MIQQVISDGLTFLGGRAGPDSTPSIQRRGKISLPGNMDIMIGSETGPGMFISKQGG
jgi:hypothetical protein